MRLILLILTLLVSIVASLFLGAADISLSKIAAALMGQGSELNQKIIWELRLPRTVLALLIGAGLGASGAALQSYTRNSLAAPGILGFTACAALGAVIALYFGAPPIGVTASALLGTVLGAMAILALTGIKKGAGTLILAGVGIGALATAITGLIMNLTPNPWALSEIVHWMMGTLRNASLSDIFVVAPLTGLGLAGLWLIGRDLKTLSLGEMTAQSLGVSLFRVQIILIVSVALCVGSGVAVAGAIGFVGLFVPHMVRMVFGADPERLILRSALAGAIFLLLVDMMTRILSGPGTPLYLGILTSLIGVPFFLFLVVREVRS